MRRSSSRAFTTPAEVLPYSRWQRRRLEPGPVLDLVFFARQVSLIWRRTERHFTLGPELTSHLINPNTQNLSLCSASAHDAEIARGIYERVPILIDESEEERKANPWGVSFRQGDVQHVQATLICFATSAGTSGLLPLYEGEDDPPVRPSIWDIRGTDARVRRIKGKLPELSRRSSCMRTLDLDKSGRSYWVAELTGRSPAGGKVATVESRLGSSAGVDITSAVTSRTVIAAVIPRVGVGHKHPPVRDDVRMPSHLRLPPCSLTSTASRLDYVARQKLGGTSPHLLHTSSSCLFSPRRGIALRQTGGLGKRPTRSVSGSCPASLSSPAPPPTFIPSPHDCGYHGPPLPLGPRATLPAALRAGRGLLPSSMASPARTVDYIMDTFPHRQAQGRSGARGVPDQARHPGDL